MVSKTSLAAHWFVCEALSTQPAIADGLDD
jgi:hypothetical protein